MKRTKCEECNGRIEKIDIELSIRGNKLGKFPAEVCQKCGEEVFDEKTSKQIEKITKERKLWGIEAPMKPSKNRIIIEN